MTFLNSWNSRTLLPRILLTKSPAVLGLKASSKLNGWEVAQCVGALQSNQQYLNQGFPITPQLSLDRKPLTVLLL